MLGYSGASVSYIGAYVIKSARWPYVEKLRLQAEKQKVFLDTERVIAVPVLKCVDLGLSYALAMPRYEQIHTREIVRDVCEWVSGSIGPLFTLPLIRC